MKRLGFAALFLLGFALAGGVSAAVVATTTTTTTATTTTSTAPTATTSTNEEPAQTVLPAEVTIAGVSVGGLAPTDAYVAVRAAFEQPLVLLAGRHRYAVDPENLGAVAYAQAAVDRARSALPGTQIPLTVVVHGDATRQFVRLLAERLDRAAVDSRLLLRDLRPFVTKDVAGRRLDRLAAAQTIVRTLLAGKRGPLRLAFKPVASNVTRKGFGPVIVIRRGSNHLLLYRGMRLTRSFGVATGQTVYPTPLGRFQIVVKWRNPWWYPPASPWAQGKKPIPPGPGNPLGTRWMGLSAPGVGIHGTPDAASIGYSASHGCIRMLISDAEWLFNNVEIGTTVFIVAS